MKNNMIMILIVFLVGIFSLSCDTGSFLGGGGSKKKDDPVTSITITPETLTTTAGDSTSFKALDNNGEDVSSQVDWNSEFESVAVSEGEGKFRAKKAGKTSITASLDDLTASANLSVERFQDIEDGVEYSRLVWGIENCIDGAGDKGRSRKPCLGDCDDAFLIIDGNLTLGTSKGTIYLISDEDQTLTFTTYSGTWNWKGNSEEELNPENSVVKIEVLDKFDQVEMNKSLHVHKRGFDYYTSWGQVEQLTIEVKKGDAIDLESHFEGTVVGEGKGCPKSNIKLTRSKDADTGFFLEDTGCGKSYCSVKR